MLPKRHENVTLDFGYFQVIFEYFRTKSLEKRWEKNTCESPRHIFKIILEEDLGLLQHPKCSAL